MTSPTPKYLFNLSFLFLSCAISSRWISLMRESKKNFADKRRRMDRLPILPLSIILRNPAVDELCECALVCKRWRQIIYKFEDIWLPIVLRILKRVLKKQMVVNMSHFLDDKKAGGSRFLCLRNLRNSNHVSHSYIFLFFAQTLFFLSNNSRRRKDF